MWICATFNTQGKSYGASKQIPESILIALSAEILGTEALDGIHYKITAITVENGNALIFTLANGKTSVKRWQDLSRAESWTEGMRNAARQKTLERKMKK